ncbi:hypothetical protein ACLK17_02555 [Escherichia coli]
MTGIFAASSLGGVGFAGGVTMAIGAGTAGKHRHYDRLVRCGGIIGYKLADLTVGLVYRKSRSEKGWSQQSRRECL